MASLAAASVTASTGFDGETTFYEQMMALNSRHKKFMTDCRYYEIYVYSPFVNHHCIVLADKKGAFKPLTIELTVNDIDTIDGVDRQTAPKSRLYLGKLNDLNYKGEVYCTLERLCEVAYRVLKDMGSYNLAFNNCQHFCDRFLKQIGLPGHMTDTAKIGWFAALGGVILAAIGLHKYLSSNNNENNENDSHEKKKRIQK